MQGKVKQYTPEQIAELKRKGLWDDKQGRVSNPQKNDNIKKHSSHNE